MVFEDLFRCPCRAGEIRHLTGVQIIFVAQGAIGRHQPIETVHDDFGRHALIVFAAHLVAVHADDPRRSRGRWLPRGRRRFTSATHCSCKSPVKEGLRENQRLQKWRGKNRSNTSIRSDSSCLKLRHNWAAIMVSSYFCDPNHVDISFAIEGHSVPLYNITPGGFGYANNNNALAPGSRNRWVRKRSSFIGRPIKNRS